MKSFILIFLAVLLLPSVGTSQDCIDIGDCLHWVGGVDMPSGALDVAVSGSYAYVADWVSGLQMINITNPASPQIVGSVDIVNGAMEVAISGTHAYVVDTITSLLVIELNLTAPHSPIVGSVDWSWYWESSVAISGNYAYVGVAGYGVLGLHVVDITIPESPQIVGSVDTPGYTEGVAISGTHAFVAGDFGLNVIDITNPALPYIVGSVDTPGDAFGVAVSGEHAFVADGGFGLQMIDITDPANPQIVGSVDTPGEALGVAVSGDYVYVADYESGLQILSTQCEPAGVDDHFDDVPGSRVSLTSYPNPFNPQTTIVFGLGKQATVSLRVYDIEGRLVRGLIGAEPFDPGRHEVVWNGRDDSGRQVASGTYFYRLDVGSYSETKRMVLLK